MPDLTRKIKGLPRKEKPKKTNPRCPKISPEKKEQGYYCDGKGFIRLDFRKNQLYKQKQKQKEKYKPQEAQPRKVGRQR